MARPKGSKNVKTQAWETLGSFIVGRGAERFIRSLREMDDEDYVKTYLKVLAYFKPKQLSTSIKQEGDIHISFTKEDEQTIDNI